jgi:quercetin dioxygenase-like cupin family protein
MTRSRRIYNPLQKDAATFLQTSEETGGVCSLLEIEVAPGGGNMLHYHSTFAEHFTVLSGEFGVQIGKDRFTLKPSESAVAPAMSVHRWYNTTQQTATVQVELRPGSAGFERAIQIAYGLVRDGLADKQGLPRSLVHKAILFDMSDTNVPGFFSVVAPLLRLIAKRAHRHGVDRELVARYCQLAHGGSGS